MSFLNIFGLLSGFFGSAYIMYFFWGYDKKDALRWYKFLLGIACCLTVASFLLHLITLIAKPITPMDVYKGRTELKYEVVGGVKVDSVVIWKKADD